MVVATLNPPPLQLGATHWSSRLLAADLGIGNATVARIWRRWNMTPAGSSTWIDPPGHSWLRRLIAQAFTSRRVE